MKKPKNKRKMMLLQLIKINNKLGSNPDKKKQREKYNEMEKFLFLYYDGSYFSHGVGFPSNFII